MSGKTRGWLATAPAMVLPFVGALVYFVILGESRAAKAAYGFTKLFTLAWPLIAVLAIYRERLPRFRLGDAKHWRALPLGAITGLAVAGLMLLLMKTPIGAMTMGEAEQVRGKAQDMGILAHYWTFALFLSLIHSLLEEYYWRWFVYGRLRELTPGVWAHVLAGVAFGLHHVVITAQFFSLGWGLFFGAMVGVGGVIWSVMLARQGTLGGIWLSHVLIDLAAMAIGHKIIFGAYLGVG